MRKNQANTFNYRRRVFTIEESSCSKRVELVSTDSLIFSEVFFLDKDWLRADSRWSKSLNYFLAMQYDVIMTRARIVSTERNKAQLYVYTLSPRLIL